MSNRDDIPAHKARLAERIAAQRIRLAGQVHDLQPLFSLADRGIAVVKTLRAHPGWTALAFGIVLALKPGRMLRWLRRGAIAWRTWRWARGAISQYLQSRQSHV